MANKKRHINTIFFRRSRSSYGKFKQMLGPQENPEQFDLCKNTKKIKLHVSTFFKCMFGNRISWWTKGVLKAPDVIASLSLNTTLLVWGTCGMTLQDQLQRLQQPCSDILRFWHWCWPIVGNFGKEKSWLPTKHSKEAGA